MCNRQKKENSKKHEHTALGKMVAVDILSLFKGNGSKQQVSKQFLKSMFLDFVV